MADVISRLKLESGEFDSKIARASKGLLTMEKECRAVGGTLAVVEKEQLDFVRNLGKMETVSQTTTGKLNEMKQAFTELSMQYRNLTAAEKSAPFGKALSASLTQLQGRIKTLQTDLNVVQTSLGSKIGGGFLQGMGSGLSTLGPVAAGAAAATAAITGMKKVMTDIVQINIQFEQSASGLAAVLGATTDEIKPLTEQAKTLGATTQYTATQILTLQTNLARLGFDQTEILNSTKAIQGMATAMGADLGEAANLAGSALRGFGLNATEMERVASVLSVGTTKSALSFEKLATALPVVQTAAAKTGFTIEDTVAMLGKLTDNGINAASAATQLRKILNDSTTAGTKLANALGGPVKNFNELVIALDKASKAGQDHADSVALVNSKNATALDILRDMSAQRTVEIDGVKKQTSALQDLRDSITDCAKGMQDMQDKQLNTLQGSVTILNSAWEGLMLTFSESNGTIKKVTDSLTDLLTAYTNWRKRNNGGDEAISTFELGMTEEQRQTANQVVAGYRAGGATDKEIEKNLTSTKTKLQEEEAELRKVYDLWEKRNSLIASGKSGLAQSAEFASIKGMANTTDVRDDLAKQIASKRDQIAVQDYMLSIVAPAPAVKTAAEEEKEEEDRSKGRLKVLKAQYEEQEKMQIAALDRMSMNEEDYEAKVYQIKRETLQKIADLYQEETAEKARANAAMADLDIRYQATQIRLANKANKQTKADVPITFTEKGISALGTKIKDSMSQLSPGSGDYLLAAENMLDYTTFQTLLNTALKNGLTIDTEWFSSLFEDIKIGADVNPETWQALEAKINAQLAALNLKPIKLDVETGGLVTATNDAKNIASSWAAAANAVSAVGSAMQQIDDPTAKIAGIVAQAIANVAAGLGQMLAMPQSAAQSWGWIPLAISGTATMISTISAIKSATGYAEGGMVGGNSYSGDNIVARLNSGEGVLTARGVENAASMAEMAANPFANLQLTTKVQGTDLLVILNNANRSMGGSRSFYTERH